MYQLLKGTSERAHSWSTSCKSMARPSPSNGPTKSPQPGTTLVPIKLRMSKGKSKWHAFDTPGVFLRHHELLHARRKHNIPLTKLKKPTTYNVAPGQSLFIGGLCRIDVGKENGLPSDRVLLTPFSAFDTHGISTSRAAEKFSRGMSSGKHVLCPIQGDLEPALSTSIGDLLETYGSVKHKQKMHRNVYARFITDIALPGVGGLAWPSQRSFRHNLWRYRAVA